MQSTRPMPVRNIFTDEHEGLQASLSLALSRWAHHARATAEGISEHERLAYRACRELLHGQRAALDAMSKLGIGMGHIDNPPPEQLMEGD